MKRLGQRSAKPQGKRTAKRLLVAALTLLVLALPSRAWAQLTDFDKPAISVERLWSEPGPGAFVAGTDASVLPVGAMSVSFLASLMSRPLVLTDLRTGEEASVPVALRLGYELTLARGITDKLQIGLALPMVAAQDGDRLQKIGLSEESLAPIALGDLRLHGKLRLQEDLNKAYAYGVSFYLALPTGDEDNFAGERSAVFAWNLVASYRWRGLRVAGNAGIRLRTSEVILLSPARPNGNELIGIVAAEYALPRFFGLSLAALGELVKVRGDDGGPSPGEWRLGVSSSVGSRLRWRIAAGQGFTPDELGAPSWRLASVVQYALP